MLSLASTRFNFLRLNRPSHPPCETRPRRAPFISEISRKKELMKKKASGLSAQNRKKENLSSIPRIPLSFEMRIRLFVFKSMILSWGLLRLRYDNWISWIEYPLESYALFLFFFVFFFAANENQIIHYLLEEKFCLFFFFAF